VNQEESKQVEVDGTKEEADNAMHIKEHKNKSTVRQRSSVNLFANVKRQIATGRLFFETQLLH